MQQHTPEYTEMNTYYLVFLNNPRVWRYNILPLSTLIAFRLNRNFQTKYITKLLHGIKCYRPDTIFNFIYSSFGNAAHFSQITLSES